LYRTPVTRIENVEEPFSTEKDVHFCPGAGGGGEWNSPAHDPVANFIFTGQVEWCTTVRLQTRDEVLATSIGQPWTGEKSINPFNVFGKFTRADGIWAGWLHAVDADSGVWKWRLKSNYPILGAVTPTAGGLVLFGDAGGNFYAFDAAKAVGSEDRRRDRRRSDHLYSQRRAKSRGDDRLHFSRFSGSNPESADCYPRSRG